MGKAIGHIHKVTTDFAPSKREFKRIDWIEDQLVLGKFIPETDTKIKQVLAETIVHIQSLQKDENSFGLIHTDIHSGNIICDEQNNLKIIDFDDSAYMYFISDLAISVYYGSWHLNFSPGQRAEFSEKIFSKILKGYRQEFTLDKKWFSEIPYFLKLRDITLYSVFNQKFEIDDMSEGMINLLT